MKTEKIIISISGMHCASCVLSIETALKSFKGVIDAQVNFANERALVEYDPAVLEVAALENIIEGTGYSVIRTEGSSSSSKEPPCLSPEARGFLLNEFLHFSKRGKPCVFHAKTAPEKSWKPWFLKHKAATWKPGTK